MSLRPHRHHPATERQLVGHRSTAATTGAAVALFTLAALFPLAALSTLLNASPAAAQSSRAPSCVGTVAPPAPFLVVPSAEETASTATSEVLLVGTAGTSYSLLALSTGNDPVRRVGQLGEAGLARIPLPLADGSWLLGATVADRCGKESASFNIVAEVALPAPEIERLSATIDGSSLTVNVATDRPANVEVTVIDRSGDTVERRTIPVDGPTSRSRSFSLVDGDYRVQARATDDAGRTGAAELSRPVTADVTAPQVSLSVPVLSVEPESVSIRVVAEAGATVSLTGRGLPVTAEYVSTGVAREYQFATEPGDYTLVVNAVDANGNTFERSVRTRVRPQPTPLASPLVVGTSIAALLLATAMLWRWLQGRDSRYGEGVEAPVLQPRNA